MIENAARSRVDPIMQDHSYISFPVKRALENAFARGCSFMGAALVWLATMVFAFQVQAQTSTLPPPPGGPILLVTDSSDPFGDYYQEILFNEGLNAFDVTDISTVTASDLNNHDIAILAQVTLNQAQVTLLSDWVTGGGQLIAMRPDPQLAALLGLSGGQSSLSEGYLLIDTSKAPGNGLVDQTIQFHGTADLYTLNGAESLATLYSDASTATPNPAVTLRSVGANGGQAAAFTYDLARSIVYTRQGNPAWADQERDGFSPIRSDDKYFGDAAGDPQSDWIDLNKVAIPQADEQQRLLANLILKMNLANKPLPRFWYFPRGERAVVLMTGDDHANNGTEGRFDQFLALSTPGCSVDNWECIRGTSYIYPDTPLSDAAAAAFDAAGFEISLHLNTGCADFTYPELQDYYTNQLAEFATNFPSLPAPLTERHHCIVWSDWVSGAKVQLLNGIRLDTSYYYWPPGWVQDRPGFFNGSGMPMRFADLDGSRIDVFLAESQMTDESGQTYPFTIDTLLDRALGPEGYYGVFTINAHTDFNPWQPSDAVVTSATTRGVPVITARQLLTWLDGRNASSFGSLSWSDDSLSFVISQDAGANGLQAMLPLQSVDGVLTELTLDGSPIQFTSGVIKGVPYAIFAGDAGAYVATYGPDTVPPTVVSTTPADGAIDVGIGTTVTAVFSEAMDATTINTTNFELSVGGGAPVAATVTYDAATRTARLTPNAALVAQTGYSATITGGVKDLTGNALAADFNWSFTTGAQPCIQQACVIWPSSPTPANPSEADPNAVELGVKFRSDIDGFITGIRFYKGSANTGTHIGSLWGSGGQLLARVTFTNETASGWQQADFPTPVAVTADTVYVASYHAPAGNYAGDNNFFASNGVDTAPLHALRDGEIGGNGVYAYGGTPSFPSNTWNSSNYWVDVALVTSLGPDTTPPTVTSMTPANGATDVSIGTTVTAQFSEAMDQGTIIPAGETAGVSNFELRDPANAPVPASITYDAGSQRATLTPSAALEPGATYTAKVVGGATGVTDVAGNALVNDVAWSFTTVAADTTPPTVTSMTPTADATGVATGTTVTAVFSEAMDGGTIDGTSFELRDPADGIVAAVVTYDPGSQIATLTPTAALATSTTYTAKVTGGATGVTDVAGNPLATDVTWSFTATAAADTTAPTVTSTTPTADATGVATSTTVTAVFDEPMNGGTIGTTTFELHSGGAAGPLVAAGVAYDGPSQTATLTPTAALAASTTYTAILKGGAGGVTDLAGNALAANVTWSFTTAATGGGAPLSIWSASATPAVLADPDTGAVELGVKFRSDSAGHITGLRFYKGSTNTGTHVGTLWTITGQQLATATFSNETASGWQQVDFATPVVITADTVYVASYHAPNGHYSADNDYFAAAGVDNAPLHALQDGESGGNGVYNYGATPAFPTDTYRSSNYWVDVVFVTSIGPDTTPPTVTSTSPANGAVDVNPATTVTATFSEGMDTDTINTSTFELRDPSNILVPASVSLAGNTATLTPSSALAENTAYTAKVTGGTDGAKDLAGNALAADQQWQFTTGVDPCSTGGNPIVCENGQPGNPPSEWDISGSGDATIQGFATDISVNRGQAISFKIDTDATDYQLDIYRMGYYGGDGARHIATVLPSAELPQNQPDCLYEQATGLTDCGNWSVSASWQVPANATSGIYFAKVVDNDTGDASHIVFIVRDDTSTSDVLFQTSDTTWQAYNQYGGNSLYVGGPGINPGRAYKVSYNRPFDTRSPGNAPGQDWLFDAEYPMVRWLEANGYDVTYFTGVDSDRRGDLILNHKVFLSVGHDEYWSGQQRANVEAARDAGVNLAFFSGNEIFWKTRWENSIDGSATTYRTLVSYKETHANAPIDPEDPPTWTGTWRDPRFSPPADGGRPENALSGTIFTVNDGTAAIRVPAADGKMRFWRDTSIATLGAGATATLAQGTLGYEWDEDLDNGFRPEGLVRMSTTTLSGADVIQDYGSNYASGTATHHLTLYRHESGALVFAAGTIQWPWGLDGNHDGAASTPDPRMQQATVNLFADMGAQPQTLQAGLVQAAETTDTVAPVAIITSPVSGAAVQPGVPLTITGTATDSGGGVVGGVEVSVDGGVSWHPATGRGSWTYQWTPAFLGSVTIFARAVDDSGNLETTGDAVSVTVSNGDTTPPTVQSMSPTNGATDVGIGTTVTAVFSEAMNATTIDATTFALRDEGGVPVAAGVTYDAGSRTATLTPNATLATSTSYTATVTGGVEDLAGNALATDFTWSFATVDIDTTPPTVQSMSPTNGATDVGIGTTVTAVFSEAMDATTIDATTFALRDEGGVPVAAGISYNAATRTATLTPDAALTESTGYTATVTGGTGGVTDVAGNALVDDAIWSFTTGTGASASCPCSIWDTSAVPAVLQDPDTSAVELGVKFRSDVDGQITGIRFYKGSANTGTHVGSLWTTSGQLLAQATFGNETASGWQQVNFASPVAITANTVYVASYHAPVARYSVDENYFAAAGVDNAPMHALSDGENGGNGVYVYGATPAFPSSTYNSSNYWVDVVFEPSSP